MYETSPSSGYVSNSDRVIRATLGAFAHAFVLFISKNFGLDDSQLNKSMCFIKTAQKILKDGLIPCSDQAALSPSSIEVVCNADGSLIQIMEIPPKDIKVV